MFTRDEGKLTIKRDRSFYPFFYEPDKDGEHRGYDGVPLRKVMCGEPSDMSKMRSKQSYSSDIRFPISYMTHRVKKLEKTKIKDFFMDIEVLTPEIPVHTDPKYPISCISVYDGLSKQVLPFFIKDYEGKTIIEQELKLLENFIDFIQYEKPDLWLSWNVSFDYPYLFARYEHLTGSSLAKKLSPINLQRRGYEQDIYYPSGINKYQAKQ